MTRFFTAIASIVLSALTLVAAKHEPYNLPRIYWDINTKQQIFPSGNYARMTPLQDGRLMVVAESGGGISCCYSKNGGQTWSAPEMIIRSASDIPFSVPDLIQLTDGTIIVGYNPRPSRPYTEDRKFGIRVMRSTDNGKTWQGPIFVYDAQHTFEDGCWEPSFLELPSGEVQLYFANEGNFTHSGEQEISMCRSFDQGQTWSDAVRICYRAGSRDGMPAAILTDNGEIVVIVEDNGHPNRSNFRATTVRSSLEDNWSNWVDAWSPNRNMIFADDADKNSVSAAPYIRKLKTGETIASWQGDRGNRAGVKMEEYDMYVAVGDKDAKNFKAITQPFGLPLGQKSIWNSLCVDHNGDVFAVGSIGNKNQTNSVTIMKGYPMKGFMANHGTPEINGSFSGEKWTAKNAQQIFMGTITRKRSTMDFLYDKDNLYFYARVVDKNAFTDKVDNDGITLALDIDNCCDTYPQKGMFRMFLDANGSISFYEGNGGKWNKIETPETIKFVANVKSLYYDMEVAIPWSVLGCESAPIDKDMRCFIEVRDRRDSEIVNETIPDAVLRQSWTWPEFKLNPDGFSGIDDVWTGNNTAKAKVTIENGNICVTSSRDITCASIFSITGSFVKSDNCVGTEYRTNMSGRNGIYIINVTDIDGNHFRSKLLIK